MKNIFYVTFVLFTIISCKTTDKLISQGNLNEAWLLCNSSAGAKKKDCLTKIGYVYLSSGETETAAKLFDEANDLNGLNKAAKIFLDKNDYENFSKYNCFAKRQEQFSDDFTSDLYKWSLISEDNAEIKRGRGKFTFTNSDNGYVKIISPSEFSFDLTRNFIISTTFRRIDSNRDKSAMITWGLDSGADFCAFGILDNGEYLYAKPATDKWVYMIDRIESNAVIKGKAENTLTLVKSDDKVIFYINDTYVSESAFDRSKGNKIGFLIESGVSVELSDYRLYTIPSLANLYQQNAKQATENEKYDQAIFFLSKLGDKDRLLSLAQSRFMHNDLQTCERSLDSMHISSGLKNTILGNFYLANNESAKAKICFDQAGFSGTADMVKTIYNDNFTDNRNNWNLGKNDYSDCRIENGNFIYKHFSNNFYIFYTPSLAELDQDLDFSAECVIKKLDGENSKNMDLIWGFKDKNNFQSFGADNEGIFILAELQDGKWNVFDGWTEVPSYIKNGNNILTVVRDSSTIRCFINNHLVCSNPYVPVKGLKFGFGVSGEITVAIDRLTVKQLAPRSFVQDICRKENLNNTDILRIASYYLNRFDYPKALEFAEKCNDYNIISRYVPFVVEELLLRDRPDDAILLCDKHLSDKNKGKSYVEIGNYLFSKHRYDEAEKILVKAGRYKEAYFKLAELSEIKGKAVQGRKYKKLTGDMYFDEKDYKMALEYYTAANESAGIEKIVDVYIVQKDFQKALEIAKKANHPDIIQHVQTAQAKDLMGDKKYEEAAKLFQEAGNTIMEKECYRNLGNEMIIKKEYEQAEKYYEQAGAGDRLNALYQTMAGDYFKDGDYSKAKIYYEKLGNEKKAKECEAKIQSLPVRPGKWVGEHITFTVDNDSKNISVIYIAFPIRNSDQYSMSMSYSIEIINNEFNVSFSYPDEINVKGVFASNTKAIITFDGIYVNNKKGKYDVIARWDEEADSK